MTSRSVETPENLLLYYVRSHACSCLCCEWTRHRADSPDYKSCNIQKLHYQFRLHRKKKLEERKTDGNILAVTVCSTVGVFRIKHLRGCNSATLKMKTAPLSETLVKLTIVQGQPFSDLYPP